MFLSGSALPGRMSTVGAGDDRVADLHPGRLQDVALLAVGVGQQRDARRAVRVVLDGRDLGRNVRLVALEVDDPVVPLVAAAAPPRGQLAVVVAAARLAQRLDQRLVRLGGRDLVEHLHGLEPAAGRRRVVLANGHDRPPIASLRRKLPGTDLLAVAQLDVGLLPVGPLPDEAPLPLELAVRDRRPHALDLRAEQLLDGALDVHLVGADRDLEHQRPRVLAEERRLLGDQRPADDVSQFHVSFSSSSGASRALLQLLERRARQR